MDKLKIYLAVALKNRFWILCGVVSILGLGSWYVASASLRDTTKKNIAEIDGAFGTADSLAKKGITPSQGAQPCHPNEETKANTEALIKELTASVDGAWAKQYEHQGKDVFVWPEELTKDFVDSVAKLRPIETTVPSPTPVDKELRIVYRGIYRDYIEDEFPKLAEIVGARWKPGESVGGGGAESPGGLGAGPGGLKSGPGGGAAAYPGSGSGASGDFEVDKSIVDWSMENQSYIQNVRFNWSHMPDQVPNTLQILYAQEDLWVLKALLEIIRKTNGDADSRHTAAIRRIVSIRLGADAVSQAGTIMRLGGGSAAGTMGAGSGASSSYPGSGQGSATSPGGSPPGVPGGGGAGGVGVPGMPGPGPGGPAVPGMPGPGPGAPGGLPGGYSKEGSGVGGMPGLVLDPAEHRYVDRNYVALTAAKLRGAATSKSADDAYLAVAKRMPVRITLEMDQRKLNTFLVECGNSPLTVEVRQVRFNPTSGASGGSDATSNMSGPGALTPGGVPGGKGGSDGGYNPGSSNRPGGMTPFGGGPSGENSSALMNPHPWDRPIEIYGIVYIYNPPDPEKLKLATTGVTPAPAAPAAAPPAGGVAPGGAAPGSAPPAPAAPAGGAAPGSAPPAPAPAGAAPGSTLPAPAPGGAAPGGAAPGSAPPAPAAPG